MTKGEFVFIFLVGLLLVILAGIYLSFRVVTLKYKAMNRKASVVQRLLRSIWPFGVSAEEREAPFELKGMDKLVLIWVGTLSILVLGVYASVLLGLLPLK